MMRQRRRSCRVLPAGRRRALGRAPARPRRAAPCRPRARSL